ncbi:MAG TPA: acetylornithine transaminase [Candidatus Dormibacteraeota bacterium]|nr:acetylornithine transaminase [Candidatus Dormibacteraeota bacterium]
MTLEEVAAVESRYLMHTFKRQPIELVRGEGARVWDAEGNELLDFVGGIAVNVLGHAHPAVVSAIARQASTLIHASNLYYSQPQLQLAEQLSVLGFEGRCFFANSGAEANEAAIKLARKWGKLNRGGAYEVISALGSFHGRTLAMVAATGQPKYQAPYTPMPDGFRHVPFNDIAALRAALSDRTVAILLEPIMGECGVVPADPRYLRAVRELCDRENLLLIFDEIQTGMGRTGDFYAFQGFGVMPDVVTLAKGLGGGVPIGVCIAAPRADVFEHGDHGSTFGGNPLACAAAVATLEVIKNDDLVCNARVTGQYLEARAADRLAPFGATRGRGLMQALVLHEPLAQEAQAAALKHGLIVNAIGANVLRMVPPLTIGEAEVDQAIRVLKVCLDGVSSHVRTPEAPGA